MHVMLSVAGNQPNAAQYWVFQQVLTTSLQNRNGADLTFEMITFAILRRCSATIQCYSLFFTLKGARLPATSNSAAQLLLENYFQLELNMQGEKTETSGRYRQIVVKFVRAYM